MSTLPVYDYSGNTIVITGGTTGIGLAVARAFCQAGANVHIAGLINNPGQLETELQALASSKVSVQPVDVRKEEDIRNFIKGAIDTSGGIDIAFNNAGIEGPFGPLHELDKSEFATMLDTNVLGIWLAMKYEIQHMISRSSGVIINTASTAGVQSIPMVAAYSATKHAILGLTRGAALEQAANGIRVNAIAPGPVDTGLLERMIAGQVPKQVIADSVPLKRISSPEEIAQAVLWLASDAAAYVTAETLLIDGGLTQA